MTVRAWKKELASFLNKRVHSRQFNENNIAEQLLCVIGYSHGPWFNWPRWSEWHFTDVLFVNLYPLMLFSVPLDFAYRSVEMWPWMKGYTSIEPWWQCREIAGNKRPKPGELKGPFLRCASPDHTESRNADTRSHFLMLSMKRMPRSARPLENFSTDWFGPWNLPLKMLILTGIYLSYHMYNPIF